MGGIVDGVKIRAIEPRNGRVKRWLFTVREVVQAAISERGDVYHFHDPELLPFMVLLKWMKPSTKVIYDTHEDMPSTIAESHWLPKLLRAPVSFGVRLVERFSVLFLDGIVAATPAIARNFPPSKTVVVQNFPRLDEFTMDAREPREDGQLKVVYTGRIGRDTLGTEVIEAIDQVSSSDIQVTLTIAGKLASDSYLEVLEAIPGWSKVEFVGWKSRGEMLGLLRGSDIGLVLLHEGRNNVEAQPNKLFEYMAVGLPVVASNFPWWREIVEGSKAGVLVDPSRPDEIAAAIEWLMVHPDEAAVMGEYGRKAVRERFNWGNEASTLTSFYCALLEDTKEVIEGRSLR
jgi:glycosyltransferase involved in cell wall biosynthesis